MTYERSAISSPGGDTGDDWRGWLRGRILPREAARAIETSPAPESGR